QLAISSEETHRNQHLAVTVSRALDYAQFLALRARRRRFFIKQSLARPASHTKKQKAAQGRLCILQLAA
ncbi:hypothetical protein ACSFBM_23120, partial [Variovorax sp. GB1R11]|uniref:hypothetical protein n=1 Tax=Variovorax sp. GB1R11 TaxID=3443741 RepID=UPI003F47E47F